MSAKAEHVFGPVTLLVQVPLLKWPVVGTQMVTTEFDPMTVLQGPSQSLH